jgi:hypothetical protein
MARQPTATPGNAARVLRLVHEDGPVTRAELTRRTGLNRSTILALVGELVDAGLVHEETPAAGTPGAGVGRPSGVVRASGDVLAAAVTVEIDAVGVALVGLDGTVRDRLVEPQTTVPTAAQAIDAVARVLAALLARTGPAARIVGVGVAVPGIVRVEDGTVRDAPHLGWRDEPLAAPLAERRQPRCLGGTAVRQRPGRRRPRLPERRRERHRRRDRQRRPTLQRRRRVRGRARAHLRRGERDPLPLRCGRLPGDRGLTLRPHRRHRDPAG